MTNKIEVTSTPSILIWNLLQEIGKALPTVNAVYQPTLSYADGLKALREENNRKQIVDTTSLPLLLFNRSVIRNSTEFQKRSRHTMLAAQRAAKDINSDIAVPMDKYKVLFGEMDFRFMYITTSMEELERFEMLYMTGVLLKDIKRVTIDIPNVGEVEYKLEWESLEDFELNLDDGFYKTIGASVKIHGAFIVSLGETIGVIKDIFTGGAVNLHIEG